METVGIRGGRVSAVTKSSSKLGIAPTLSSVLGGHRSPQVTKSDALTIDLTKYSSAKQQSIAVAPMTVVNKKPLTSMATKRFGPG